MFKSIEEFIGNTPLVKLKRLPGNTGNTGNTVPVKLEGGWKPRSMRPTGETRMFTISSEPLAWLV